jgi:hypothetical protein
LTRLGQAALRYAEQGRPVFPVAPGGKVPAIPRAEGGQGFKDATTDPDQIRAWWQRWPNANVGMPTGKASGLVVLDVDARAGGYGSLAVLEAGREGLVTLEAATPGGGAHLYFTAPDVELRNSAGKLGEGLDIRADGGYVVLPPSERPEGAYVWCERRPPADMPVWLLELLLPKPASAPAPLPAEDPTRLSRYGYHALADELHAIRRAPVGQRNDTLNRAAFSLGQLVGAGVLPEHLVVEELLDSALRVGLTEREARATIVAAMARGAQHPRRPR